MKFISFKRKLAAPPQREPRPEETPQHARAVKAFVRDYTALQERCANAFNHNNESAGIGFIDQMKRMERRVRFVPDQDGAHD